MPIYKLLKYNKLAPVLLSLIIICFSILGIVHVDNTNKSLSFIKNELTGCSAPLSILNKITKEIFSDVITSSKTIAESKRKQAMPGTTEKKSSNLIMFLLSSLFLVSENNLAVMLIVISVMILIGGKKIICVERNSLMGNIKNKFYLIWRNMFLTPEEKCLEARSEEYDINLLMNLGMVLSDTVERTRTLFKGIKCGFFNV